MKVLHTTDGFEVRLEDTSTCTYDLLSAIHKVFPDEIVDTLATDVSDPDDVFIGVGEDWIKTVPNDCKTPLSISTNMTIFLNESEYDIYHTNGMWKHINHMTCSIARSKKKPYVITPHGMLYPEALKINYWKKWTLMKLWFDRDIKEATAIHATCETEMNHIRALGYKGPIAVIGNPVYVPNYTEDIFNARGEKSLPFLSVGFLGKLHPIKKVESIINGVALTQRKDVHICIIGKGNKKYEKFLNNEVSRLGLDKQTHFIGLLNGFDKYAQLGLLDALFVPSEMENFGMIVPESLIVGTPVMASLGTPWSALNEEKCGWWVDNSPESIANIIKDLTSKTHEERIAMAKRGRDYILRTFSAEKIASQMLSLYRWLLGEAEKPDFVYCI